MRDLSELKGCYWVGAVTAGRIRQLYISGVFDIDRAAEDFVAIHGNRFEEVYICEI